MNFASSVVVTVLVVCFVLALRSIKVKKPHWLAKAVAAAAAVEAVVPVAPVAMPTASRLLCQHCPKKKKTDKTNCMSRSKGRFISYNFKKKYKIFSILLIKIDKMEK